MSRAVPQPGGIFKKRGETELMHAKRIRMSAWLLGILLCCCIAATLGGGEAKAEAVIIDNMDADMRYTGSGWVNIGSLGSNWHSGTATSSGVQYDAFKYTHYHTTRLQWLATKSNDRGKADVNIDGIFQTTVDLYAPALTPSSAVFDSGALTPGVHTLEVVVRGDAAAGSLGVWVEIDAVEVTLAEPDVSPIRVMPLGDSITHGVDLQIPGAYRNALWNALINRGKLVDFVGVQANGAVGLGDKDHNGNPGFRIDQIDLYADGFMDLGKPEIVLLQIGTNDILQNYDLANAPARLSALIDKITAKLPSYGKLYVATIPPLADAGLNALVDMYNAAVRAVVGVKQAAGAPVYVADMNEAVKVPYPPYLHLQPDGIHPDATGYARMAEEWYNVIRHDVTQLGVGGNAALNKPVAASTYAGAGYEAEKAVDGVTDSFWIASGASPQWLQVDLGELVPITRIQTQFLSYTSFVQYKIEVSADGATWSTYVDRTINTAPRALHVDYGSANARYVRLTVTGQESAIDPIMVSEFQVITKYSMSLVDRTMEANNMFASEMMQVGGQWYLYTGGWLYPGMINNAIYVSVSENLTVDGNYTPPELVLSHGDVPMVNDPSIAIDDNGTWHMLYTLGALNPDSATSNEFPFLEQIGHSTSTDGVHWSPNHGDAASVVTFSDPYNIAGGDIVRAARPAL